MEFLTILQGLLTPVIAGLGILIGYRQWRTAQDKFRLDLFERRLEVFEVVDRYLLESLRGTEEAFDWSLKFDEAMMKARWLFEPNLVWFCKKRVDTCCEAINELWEMSRLEKKFAEEKGVKPAYGEDYDPTQDPGWEPWIKALQMQDSVKQMRKELVDVFSPYMSLRAK